MIRAAGKDFLEKIALGSRALFRLRSRRDFLIFVLSGVLVK